jgi:GNAT superfamily N-acetyltransferase
VWGYDDAFMQSCRDELTVTPAVIRSCFTQIAEINGRLVGFVQITSRGGFAEIARLFIEPTDIRTGIGRKLFEWAKATASATGAETLTIESDPSAAGFYRRMGAVDNGVIPSGSIHGRFIPRLIFRL